MMKPGYGHKDSSMTFRFFLTTQPLDWASWVAVYWINILSISNQKLVSSEWEGFQPFHSCPKITQNVIK